MPSFAWGVDFFFVLVGLPYLDGCSAQRLTEGMAFGRQISKIHVTLNES